MKKIIKLSICFLMLVASIFAINNTKISNLKNINADSLYTEVVDDNGNVVYHRNSSEPVMRLKEYTYPNQELRACWVSNFVGSLPSYQNEEQWKLEYNKVLDRMEEYGLNCIIFHVRTHNNALYKSELNPLAQWFFGVDFDKFDPLAWSIEETHRRGIEFHAWLNPYRIATNGEQTQYVVGDIPAVNPINNSSNLLQSGDSIILNPGIASNRDFIVDSCMEVVENYDVDAIHFDDYFYISGVEGDKSANWKRQQVDLFIEDLSEHIDTYNKANKKAVQLGISPSGIYQNGGYSTTPKYDANGNLTSPLASNTSGFAHYGNYLYSDTLKWINEEWIDYIMPQTYWSLEQTAAQFGSLSRWWSWAVAKKDVNLYLGMGIYMPADNSNWRKNKYEIRDQVLNASMYSEVGGFSMYSYNYLASSNVYTKTGMDILKNDYWNSKIPCDVKKGLADDFDLLDPKNVKIAGTTLSWDAQDTARGYIVYKVPKTKVLDQTDLSQIYYYGKELSVELEDLSNSVYYISVVNLANEIGNPFNTESLAASVSNMINSINELPEVLTTSDEGTVSRLKELYDSLSSSDQALVTNYQKLADALEIIQVKKQAIKEIIEYLDQDPYSYFYRDEIKARIAEFTADIEEATEQSEINYAVEDYKVVVDAYPIAKIELKTAIDDATNQLNEYFESIDLSYYTEGDQSKIQTIFEYNLDQIQNGLSEEAIYRALSNAKKNVEQLDNCKVAFDEAIVYINEVLDQKIQEYIATNEDYAKYEEKLMEIKEKLILDTTANQKPDVAKFPKIYASQLQSKLNLKFEEIEEYYAAATAAIEEINTYEDKTTGHKAIKQQYIDAINDAITTEDVEYLLQEFKVEYSNYYENVVTPSPGGSCMATSVNLLLSVFTLVSLMYLVIRRK